MQEPVMSSLRILVVGGGVAGGLIGAWLGRQEGVGVTIVEKVSADDHANAGNGLNVGPNGLMALAKVWPEKEAALRKASLPWTRWLARRADGSIAYEIPLSEVSPQPGIRIRWSELYRLARSSALENLRFETEALDVVLRDKGEVSVCLQTRGEEAVWRTFDLVVVTEGRYSAIREKLCGTPEPQQLGIANFRTLLDDDGAIEIDDMEQWFNGPARIIAFRLHDGLIYISGNLPIEVGSEIGPGMKDKAYLRKAYTPSAGEIDPRYAALIDGFCSEESVHHWARAQQIETVWNAPGGIVQFLGDAAHAMAPTLGQGATQAIEDAAVWMGLFERWRSDGGDAGNIANFTKMYSKARCERIEFVRQFSEESSDVLLLGSNTEAALAKKAQPEYRAKLERLYCEYWIRESWQND